MKLATIICYCSNDERFIRQCIDNALKVSDQVIVPVSSHWYDGTPEDMESLVRLAEEYPDVTIMPFEWEPGKHPRYWISLSRLIGYKLIKGDVDWVLFLDSDEIIEPEKFNKLKMRADFEDYDSYKISCYWYFREPEFQSTKLCDPLVLVRYPLVNINVYDMHNEREQLHEMLNVRKKRMVLHDDNSAIGHHYSWVRTKQQMLNKVKTWGHRDDRDWTTLINEEFSRDFNGTDFIRGGTYNIVENIFKI